MGALIAPRPGRVLLAAIAVVAAVVLASSRPAESQTIGSLELVAQSAWVEDGGIFSAQLRVAGAAEDSTVVFSVLSAWESRVDLLQERTAGLEPIFELEPIPLAELQDTSNEILSVEFEVADENSFGPRRPDVIPPPETGPPGFPIFVTNGESAVYPVEIRLVANDGTELDTLTTTIIKIDRQRAITPLQTSIIIETQPSATIDSAGVSLLSEEDLADLGIVIEAVARHPDAEVALSITADTLLALARSDDPDASELLELVTTLRSSQLVPAPFTQIEEQAWVDVGLGTNLGLLYDAGAELTTELTGLEPDPNVMLLDRTVTSSGLGVFARRGVEGVIVRPAQVEALDRNRFPDALTTRFLIPAEDAEPVPALVADGGLANHFTDDGGSVLRANRLLADLVLLTLQDPETRRSVVINPPLDWEPDPAFLNVLLSGLERIPVIRGASTIEALATTAFAPADGVDTLSPPLRRELDPRRAPADLSSFRTDFGQALTAVEAWSTVIANDTDSIDRLQELLFLSADQHLNELERQVFIEQVYTTIDDQKNGSITTPASDTVTLTGRLSQLPILIENNLSVEAEVVVILDSEKLSFPEGREVSVRLQPGQNRLEIPIEARASGDSPIRLQILSPDRSILLGSSEVLVRTFEFSGVGVIIGIISIIVLLLWWLRQRRARRDTVERPSADPSDLLAGEHIGVEQ